MKWDHQNTYPNKTTIFFFFFLSSQIQHFFGVWFAKAWATKWFYLVISCLYPHKTSMSGSLSTYSLHTNTFPLCLGTRLPHTHKDSVLRFLDVQMKKSQTQTNEKVEERDSRVSDIKADIQTKERSQECVKYRPV